MGKNKYTLCMNYDSPKNSLKYFEINKKYPQLPFHRMQDENF